MEQGFFCRIRRVDGVPQNCEVAARSPPRAAVQQRDKGSLLWTIGDERAHRHLTEPIEEEFRRGILTGQQWPVDSSGELQKAEAQLMAYLFPYLKKHRAVLGSGSGEPHAD
jgi:hypothetical protein